MSLLPRSLPFASPTPSLRLRLALPKFPSRNVHITHIRPRPTATPASPLTTPRPSTTLASGSSAAGAAVKKPSPHLVWYREIVPGELGCTRPQLRTSADNLLLASIDSFDLFTFISPALCLFANPSISFPPYFNPAKTRRSGSALPPAAMIPILLISTTLFLSLSLARTHLSHALSLSQSADRIAQLEDQLTRLRREQRRERLREKRERERILPIVVQKVMQRVGAMREEKEEEEERVLV